MTKIIYTFIMILILGSCATTKKEISKSTKETNINIDSSAITTDKRKIDREYSIEWEYEGDFGDIQNSDTSHTTEIPKWLLKPDSHLPSITKLLEKEKLPEKRMLPGKGKIKIKISESSSLEQKINKETKMKKKEQVKENKQNTETNVKTQKRNWLVSSIIIIIIGLIVKYAFDHKNNLKKIWKSIKKKITLH